MVERLSEENQALRQELKAYYKKVSKLEKVERDIQKVNDAYEMLARHSQKRESLEKLMRLKLEAEISRLTESNQQIQNHLEHTLLQLQKRQGYGLLDSELKKELHHKDSLIATFIAQNNELSAAKRRLESEIGKQSATVQETRSRIKVLENVLAKEVLEKRRLDRQHSASSDHQLATGNNCDGCERTSGGKTDDDILPFKYQQCDTDDGISSDSESPTNVHSLIRQMQEKERHILRLQDEVARWEQKFLEETVFRQLAVDAISIPKDAKIAALVQNSADTDKLLSDARLEKLAYLKELHNAHERCAHLEVKVKSLQADLAERDSLVRVLQHHSSLSRTSSISSLLAASCGSPLHSPQQQHRSPMSTAVHGNGSKPASGASSRQGSQLSVGSLSLTKSNKLNGGNVAMSHDVHQMAALDAVSYNDYSGDDSDQLKQCFWQV
jgi:predicted  nucleic acid-binding Zn-ribbon protein